MLERARQESVSRANNDLSFYDRNADPTQQRIGVGTAAETKKIDKSGSVGSMQAKEQCGVRKKEEKKKKRDTKTGCGGVESDAASSKNRSAAPEAEGLKIVRTQRLGG